MSPKTKASPKIKYFLNFNSSLDIKAIKKPTAKPKYTITAVIE